MVKKSDNSRQKIDTILSAILVTLVFIILAEVIYLKRHSLPMLFAPIIKQQATQTGSKPVPAKGQDSEFRQNYYGSLIERLVPKDGASPECQAATKKYYQRSGDQETKQALTELQHLCR